MWDSREGTGPPPPLAFVAVSRDYTPQEVARLLTEADVQLVDVRTDSEHAAGRIRGDRHIELSELPAHVGTLDRERPIVLYCRSGARSEMATAALAQAGFDAHNMIGGLLDWHAAGLPLDPPDGQVIAP